MKNLESNNFQKVFTIIVYNRLVQIKIVCIPSYLLPLSIIKIKKESKDA